MIREALSDEKIEKAEFVYRFTFMSAEHNYYCAVCREKSAVLECNTGTLQPCWDCRDKGYKLVQRKSKWWPWVKLEKRR